MNFTATLFYSLVKCFLNTQVNNNKSLLQFSIIRKFRIHKNIVSIKNNFLTIFNYLIYFIALKFGLYNRIQCIVQIPDLGRSSSQTLLFCRHISGLPDFFFHII